MKLYRIEIQYADGTNEVRKQMAADDAAATRIGELAAKDAGKALSKVTLMVLRPVV